METLGGQPVMDLIWGGIILVIVIALVSKAFPSNKPRVRSLEPREPSFWRKFWTYDSTVVIIRLPKAKMMRLKAESIERHCSMSALLSRKLERLDERAQHPQQPHLPQERPYFPTDFSKN